MSPNEQRLTGPPSGGFEDDDSAREYGRQLAMDLVLHQLYQTPSGRRRPGLMHGRLARFTAVAAAAAAVIVVGFVVMISRLDQSAPGSDRWEVEPRAAAQFSVIEPFHIRLEQGELRVPAAPAPRQVTIETEFASALATGAEFHISQASTPPPTTPRPFGPVEVTTIEVVSGSVTLTTPQGTIVGHAGDTLIAVEGEAPRKE